MKTGLTVSIQIAFLIIVSWLMNKLVQWLHIPVPGSILGMILVFLLLQMKLLPRKLLEAGSNWLIATMLLFFIPPAVGIISYRQLLVDKGLQIVLVIVFGTVIVMVCSGLVAQVIAKRKGLSRP
ncbi:CidA/LrgA family protein [Paenibacillus aestuarii]|uniref:CidA/LrgA family protein n=1 Tax=Paenibacillus aestuarii TaxID=516965 RepID=A0ABW0K3V8_9BACL|nr:CidA/LrgA family holin-like protein [Paenibacillus aestuarii]